MKKEILVALLIYISFEARAQYDFSAVTQLLSDSIGVIGQTGQNAGFVIVHGDSVLYEEYWGACNSQTYQPIASGSKMPSMALIMLLIDEGFLSINDTVQAYLPSFNGKPVITLHQLMNHTSGLPGQSMYISNSSLTLQESVDSIGQNTPMTSYAPGTAFQYGGVGMQVAGRMAEIATGVSWESLFQQKIAMPLGLTNTNYAGLGPSSNVRIAGGMGTTAPDFSKKLTLLLNYGRYNNSQLIDSLSIYKLQSDQTNGVPIIGSPYSNDPLRKHFRYGYGVWVEEEFNGKTTQFGSQGAFGFSPWIDRCRKIACVFFVRKSLGIVQPTQTKLRNLLEQLIPVQLQQPIISLNGSFLQSSYPDGNQWYLNDTLLFGETSTTLLPSVSGNYKVRFSSEEGCSVFSNEYFFTLLDNEAPTIEEEVTLFPNPSSSLIQVNCGNGYRIYSPMGQLCKMSSQPTTEINISDLSSGVYYLVTGNHALRFLKW